MLIIQFIIMPEDKLKKVIDKYKKKYDFTKNDYLSFVENKVDLPKKKCDKFKEIIDRMIDEQFDENELSRLLRLIAAFQAGCDIITIQEQTLQQYSKIRFKDNNKNAQNIQKSFDQPQQKQKKSRKESKDQVPKSDPAVIKNQIKVESNDFRNKGKVEKNLQSSYTKKIEISDEEDEQPKESIIKNSFQKKNSNKSKEKQSRTENRNYISINQEISDEQIAINQSQQLEKNRRRQYEIMIKKQKQQEQRQQKQKEHIQKQEIKQRQRQRQKQRQRLVQKQRQLQIQRQRQKQQRQRENRIKMISKKSSFQKQKFEHDMQRLNTIQQQRTQQIYANSRNSNNQKSLQVENTKLKQSNQSLEVVECDPGKQVIAINKFQKTGQDFMNPVIKYQIVYKQKYVTWRRYSQIQKLLAFLRYKYEGIALPEMPPKQGIKGNITYFWRSGVNQHFLEQRKQKLKQVLNRVLACQYVSQDEILIRFLQDQQYELPISNSEQSGSYLQTLVGIKDIVFNYSQLKDYGMAYYNYIADYKNKSINTECSQEYQKLQTIISSILIINQHRVLLNTNFQKRRQIMYASSIKTKGPIKTNLDKILQEAQIQCRELNQQYRRYLQLKSTEGWENLLIKQKSTQGGKTLQKIKEDHLKTVQRIAKAEINLLKSIKKFGQKNQKLLQNLGKQILDWRRKAHP